MTSEDYETLTTLLDIAITKAFNYSQEYNPYSGQVQDKNGHAYLKQGYIDGFLAGFAHKMGGSH